MIGRLVRDGFGLGGLDLVSAGRAVEVTVRSRLLW